MEGVEDIPGSALAEGITWEWETFGEYLDALERMPRAVEVGTQIPHAALRAYVMGDRALDAPTAEDLSAMTQAVTQGLRAGALGMSFGRTGRASQLPCCVIRTSRRESSVSRPTRAAPRPPINNRHIFKRLYPLGDRLDYEPSPQDSIAAIAERERRDPWEVTYDVSTQCQRARVLLLPLLNYAGNNYDHLHDMMSDPVSLQGLGDGGAHCGIVCDASMTTYLMSYWVRDRNRGSRLSLETAVHRLTGDPAAFYGLGDRGILEPGRRADLNLIPTSTTSLCAIPSASRICLPARDG